MNRSTVASRWNLDVIEDHYSRWRRDPDSVEASWRDFFEGYELGLAKLDGEPSSSSADSDPDGDWDPELETARKQAAVTRLIDAYREIGHFLADLDPLQLTKPLQNHELLDLESFGLSEADLDRTFYSRLLDPPRGTLREITAALRETYCRTIGVEYMHINNNRIRQWLQARMEPCRNHPRLEQRKKRRIVNKLNAAHLFETFLHTHYQGQKRFGLEGAETLIPLVDSLLERAGHVGVKEIVFGMPHRGRLNVLANILQKPYRLIFSEFEGQMAPETVGGDGDVKYHLGFSADHRTEEGRPIHLSLTPNPSHLEAVNPVVEGRVRAKQHAHGDRDCKRCVPVLIHGDAAFAGQGMVAETLNLSRLKGYYTGGAIHLVVNNQIGFTTAPKDARSTPYCTDVAKMIDVPIFHVNGDDPEAVVHAAEIAMDFRQEFGMDVVLDMVCYRRHGHNEQDDPKLISPLMYKAIAERPPIKDLYTKQLIDSGDMTQEQAEMIAETFNEQMQKVYDEVHNRPSISVPAPGFKGAWAGLRREYSWAPVETGVPMDILERVGLASASAPDDFLVHPTVQRLFNDRRKAIAERGSINWSFAETLAFGTLLLEGTTVRLSGQDSRRGTFSQRHSVVIDGITEREHYPLRHIDPNQGEFAVYDSFLSEAAVLGFEYGISLDSPQVLAMWEAQFGDFSNGAQVIIDQFIVPGESKWGRASGVVLLLPHGYEGQGPEHSSARLERFLQLFADDNIEVVNASTPAQYFHLLRRHMKRSFRKPLIVMTPKSLLRRPEAVSPLQDLAQGRFYEVIDDPDASDKAQRVLLCSGKVYYDLIAKRKKEGKEREVAIVRLEQFCPWPEELLKGVRDKYAKAREWVWVQEESQNMGGWTFVAPRLRELIGQEIKYVGRDASASPATGLLKVHEREQAELVEAAVGKRVPHVVVSTPTFVAAALNGKE